MCVGRCTMVLAMGVAATPALLNDPREPMPGFRGGWLPSPPAAPWPVHGVCSQQASGYSATPQILRRVNGPRTPLGLSSRMATLCGWRHRCGHEVGSRVEPVQLQAQYKKTALSAAGVADASPTGPKRRTSSADEVVSSISSGIEIVAVPVVVQSVEERRIVAANRHAEKLFGMSRSRLLELAIQDVVVDAEIADLALRSAEIGDDSSQQPFAQLRREDGSLFAGRLFAGAVDGCPGMVSIAITEFEQGNRFWAETLTSATLDDLTGLLRRKAFLSSSRLAVASGRSAYGLFFIDLDMLKVTNDRFGHHVGDAVLREVAQQIRQAFRRSDLVARFGGDEFVICSTGCTSAQEVLVQANRVERALRRTVRIDDLDVDVEASVGGVLADAGVPLEVAIRGADEAMLAVKARHRTGDLRNVSTDDIVVLPQTSERDR